jgi:hypothetical protein
MCVQSAFAARTPFGVYEGPGAEGAAKIPAFSQWFDRTPDLALDFFANDTWASLESDAAWTCYSWNPPGAGPVVPAMTFSVPLTVNGTPLSEVASGSHDSSFIAVAKSLVAYNWGSATVRLGWEFNGSWMPWAAGQDPVSYVAAYRHVVSVMRSVAGAHFKFDWCSAWGPAATAPDSVYPGDDVVDIIGMDVYNRYYSAADADPAHRWNTFLTASYGLNWLVSFAQSHQKRISVPEWGTGEWFGNDGGIGGGDDGLFVTNMCNFMNSNDAAYSDYWDINASGYDAAVSDGEHPVAGAALRAAFGASAAIPAPGPILWIGMGASPTSTSLSINFSPPYGGGAPQYFQLLYRVTGQTAWTNSGTATSVGWQSFTGLQSAKSYDLAVKAVNAGGSGALSPVLTQSTLTAAGSATQVPGEIPWIGVGDVSTYSSISINFCPPNDGGTPTAYVIMYRVTGQTAWKKYGTVTWTGWQTLAGLASGTSYDTQVYATNSAGQGLPSAVCTDSTL